jgi:hypothetical protein
MNRFALPLAGLLSLLVLPACAPDEMGALDNARHRWAGAGVTDYSFTLSNTGSEPSDERTIWVQGGQVVDASTAAEGPQYDLQGFETIPVLFDEIDTAIQAGEIVHATYNPDFGFPESASFSSNGESTGFELLDFQTPG